MQDTDLEDAVQATPVEGIYVIRDYTKSDEDFEELWQMWQNIFPTWPIERPRLEKILHHKSLPGQHFIHERGFCLSFLMDGKNGKIAAVGVLPEYRKKGLGSALLKSAEGGLRSLARTKGEMELKSLEIGCQTPRFWPQVPIDLPQDIKDFFVHREPTIRDLYKDIRSEIAPPAIIERVSKMNFNFSPWSPELYEECMTKQRANFIWSKAYELLAAYGQHHEVMVAFDPDTNAQIGWTVMSSPTSIFSDIFSFLPLMPSKEKTGLISAVGVDESARGKGVGLALVVKAMENMRDRGIEGVYIDMVVIRNFYEKIGFETVWEYEGYMKE
ncbi:Mycothiol acetyltransferase [Lachnellula suecica]|uniref:Mycothiol acetyltransferase n=1 Tax=Lachnellula suecica TaxID=602035 RepID=A0A8T9C6S9_9HELO|nr:Mycothiol acetyltransferase [Lachnellula suecica]